MKNFHFHFQTKIKQHWWVLNGQNSCIYTTLLISIGCWWWHSQTFFCCLHKSLFIYTWCCCCTCLKSYFLERGFCSTGNSLLFFFLLGQFAERKIGSRVFLQDTLLQNIRVFISLEYFSFCLFLFCNLIAISWNNFLSNANKVIFSSETNLRDEEFIYIYIHIYIYIYI